MEGKTKVENRTLPLLSLLIHIPRALFFGAKIYHIYRHDFNATSFATFLDRQVMFGMNHNERTGI